MKCERCGATDLPDHPYDRTFVVGNHCYTLCVACPGALVEIGEHAAAGARVNLVDDTGRVWSFWVEDGKSRVSMPEETT